jgi:hypothetical protein
MGSTGERAHPHHRATARAIVVEGRTFAPGDVLVEQEGGSILLACRVGEGDALYDAALNAQRTNEPEDVTVRLAPSDAPAGEVARCPGQLVDIEDGRVLVRLTGSDAAVFANRITESSSFEG